MKIIKQTELNQEQKRQLFDLWNHEYPEKLSYQTVEDLEKYLENLREQTHYLLMNERGRLEGWAIIFTREKERWFAIIIPEKLHGKGVGTRMLNELKKSEKELNGWVIDHNLDIKTDRSFYKSPIEFYKKNNFKVISETRLELQIMSAVKIKWRNNNKEKRTE
ncbi:MAG: GNAT family N-acetyltransferase [Ginsengibacter sp.]